MSEVKLVWPGQEMSLIAAGQDGYEWVSPNDVPVPAIADLQCASGELPGRNANVLAVGDGMDVIRSLSNHTTALDSGIRLVYIDPPFNTNADVSAYNDTMNRAMWLSMLRDRLLALRPHLAENASIWLHLDDAEVHRARFILDEVFGEKSFVASVVWQKRTTRDSRAAFSSNHDTILVYAPSGPRKWKHFRNLLQKDASDLTNRDNDPRGPWADAPFTAPGFRKAQQYEIVTPSGRKLRPPRGRSWYATEETFKGLIADDRIWFPRNGSGSPRLKLFSHQLKGLVPFTVWSSSDTGTNDDAKRHLMSLFPENSVFDTPKPELLLERILHVGSNPGDLVVDLFGGSGTTATTAHKMRRRWIVSERSVETVISVLLPRLQRVVEGTDFGGISELVGWKGGGTFDLVRALPLSRKTECKGDVKMLTEAMRAFEFTEKASCA